MNPWDFKPLKSVFGHGVDILRMEPGDILILRPDKTVTAEEVFHISKHLKQLLPEGTKAYVAPANWEIAVARPSSTQDAIDGLKEIREDLCGAA